MIKSLAVVLGSWLMAILSTDAIADEAYCLWYANTYQPLPNGVRWTRCSFQRSYVTVRTRTSDVVFGAIGVTDSHATGIPYTGNSQWIPQTIVPLANFDPDDLPELIKRASRRLQYQEKVRAALKAQPPGLPEMLTVRGALANIINQRDLPGQSTDETLRDAEYYLRNYIGGPTSPRFQ